jgi:long-chain acyl-CoA synthetase
MTARPGNLADLVARAATSVPDRVALVAGDRRRTWRDLDGDVSGVAAALRSRGVRDGERVALLLPNSLEFAVAYFAVLRAGGVAVPLNTGYTEPELAHQVEDAAVSLAVTTPALAARLDVPTLLAGSAEWADALAQRDPVCAERGGADLAVLLYTSGTSGRPKGAMLTHAALLANLDQLAAIDPPVVAAADVVLLVLPLFHVYGLNAGLGMVAKAAATGVLADRFDPVETLALIRDAGVTNIVGAPPMYVAWSMLPGLADAMRDVRLAVSGAAPLPGPVLTSFAEAAGRPVYEGYGLTETSPVLTTTLCSAAPQPGSVGRPIPGVELRLVDDAGSDVVDDDPGEIVVRGPNLFSGYWPDATGGPDEDGWFRTGDIAYADESGDLFLVDRVRDLILVSGFNVYPREVEEALATHPAVAEVAVVGVPHPYTGETVRALVVPAAGATPSADELIAHAASRLARFKCPTSVELVEELPHSVTGKVAKGRLRPS